MKKIAILLLILIFNLSDNKCFSNDSLIYDLKWEHLTFPNLPQTVVYDKLDRPYFYVANITGGLLIFDANDANNPQLIKTIPIEDLGNLNAMNAHQDGNFLYLALGNFFGTNQQESGFGVIDISTPENAFVSDFWKGSEVIKGSAVVTVEGNFAYLGAMTEGLIIFDISDKTDILQLAQIIPDIHFPMPNPGAVQMPNARGIAVRNDLVYLCYDAGGIRIIDVSDKFNPVEISNYINEEVLGKQQAYNNILLNGDLAYVAVDYCGFEILDISDPENIFQVSWWNPWECEKLSNLWLNSPGHTNQIVYAESDNLIFLSAGGSELVALDVSDPAAPIARNGYGMEGNQLAVWGVELHNNKLYLSYINAFVPFFATWSGVKILDWEIEPNSVTKPSAMDYFSLSQNFPNPFSSETTIPINFAHASEIQIEVFDIFGKQVFLSEKLVFTTGQQFFHFNSNKLTSGSYFYKVYSREQAAWGKMIKSK